MKLAALTLAMLLLAGSAAHAFDGNDRILDVDPYQKLPPNPPYDAPVAFGYVAPAAVVRRVDYVPYGSRVTRTDYGVAPTHGYVAQRSYGYVAPPTYVVPPACGYVAQPTYGYVAQPTYVVPPPCGYVAPPSRRAPTATRLRAPPAMSYRVTTATPASPASTSRGARIASVEREHHWYPALVNAWSDLLKRSGSPARVSQVGSVSRHQAEYST